VARPVPGTLFLSMPMKFTNEATALFSLGLFALSAVGGKRFVRGVCEIACP
jgi:hypothetical protein